MSIISSGTHQLARINGGRPPGLPENLPVHPQFLRESMNWPLWRATLESDDNYISEYLEQAPKEETSEYMKRKKLTYIPCFALKNIEEQRNKLADRMDRVIRRGGDKTFQESSKGLLGGVDMRSSSLWHFMSNEVLMELLSMGTVGIYVDMPSEVPATRAGMTDTLHPYLYYYPIENIVNWSFGADQRFDALLLRQESTRIDDETGLPKDQMETVYLHFRRANGRVELTRYGDETVRISIDIPFIPFTMLRLNHGLLKPIAKYQVSLMNICSHDISYLMESNFPFLVEHSDLKDLIVMGGNNNSDGTASAAERKNKRDAIVGHRKGRLFTGTIPPEFIHPSSEPIKASMDKQDQMKQEMRDLVHLSILNMRSKSAPPAEAQKEDKEDQNTGLKAIGSTLQNAERDIAIIWAAYMRSREVAEIHYPQDFSYKTRKELQEEVDRLVENIHNVPSVTYKKETVKQIAQLMHGDKIPKSRLEKIFKEIDAADTVNTDPDSISKDLENGLVSQETASEARGYKKGEVKQAKKDQVERLVSIMEAQSVRTRGVDDTDPSKGRADPQEKKEQQQESAQNPDIPTEVRGEGK